MSNEEVLSESLKSIIQMVKNPSSLKKAYRIAYNVVWPFIVGKIDFEEMKNRLAPKLKEEERKSFLAKLDGKKDYFKKLQNRTLDTKNISETYAQPGSLFAGANTAEVIILIGIGINALIGLGLMAACIFDPPKWMETPNMRQDREWRERQKKEDEENEKLWQKKKNQKEETNMEEEILEGVGAYTLKKTKVEKNETEEGTQTITHYDVMLGGKKVGKLSRDDYFGQVDGELHGKPIPQTAIGSDIQAWLHKFLKSKKGAKFAMQAEAKDCGCYKKQDMEEQEFMFAMKKKQKLKESLMLKTLSKIKSR